MTPAPSRWRPPAGPLLLAPALLLLGAFFVLPLVEVGRLALDTDLRAAASELVEGPYAGDLGFTLATSVGAAAVAVAIAFVLVTAFHDRPGPAAAIVATVALLPLLVPHLIAAYAIRLLLGPSGPPLRLLFGDGAPDLVTGPVALVAALVWKMLPFAYLNARAARSAVPDDLLDAAADLGAGARLRARRILLPLMAPGLLAGGVLVAVLAAAQFSLTLVVYGGREVTTIPIDVFLLHQQGQTARAGLLGLAFAAVTVLLALLAEEVVRRRVRATT